MPLQDWGGGQMHKASRSQTMVRVTGLVISRREDMG
jgi:hypothetical protein